jgi:ABC-type nitrate/sulfonate/bicarbonate transport system permease component
MMDDTTLAASAGELEEDRSRARAVSARLRRRERVVSLSVRLASLFIVLALWQIGAAHVNPALFTSPTAVAIAGWKMILSGELWFYLRPSLVVLLYGLAISSVAGVLAGVLLARYWLLDMAFGGYITFLYATPTVALVPIIVLWAGYDTAAKTIILVLFAFFPVVINTYQGVKNVDERLLEVGHSFRCNEGQLWLHIVLPSALPFIVTGLRLAVGRGLIGMVLADLYTAISGIGYLIVRSASTYQVDKMFVPVITVGLLGVLLSAGLRLLERRVAPWTATRRD